MIVKVFKDKTVMGKAAAEQAATAISRAITRKGSARIIAATGASQFEFLDALIAKPDVDWAKIEMFHLDEYAGLPITHPASFRKYLTERLISKTGIQKHHLLDGEIDPEATIREVGRELSASPVDVAFVGIGENGHLAFNDPPADFETEEPYLLVNLDEACRRQQVGEGWFSNLSDVPRQAISMSVRQIMKTREIICVVPDERKAAAVKKCLEGEISPLAPASILQAHPNTTIYLDEESAALLGEDIITERVIQS
ncbi:MAG TPA: glucosamine-6-phosphate deaminase [Pyrinomonadaceae bacterium]|nr:glucosamine-6-phosphate deaminase [Pyrinomonadaceae bacterium]